MQSRAWLETIPRGISCIDTPDCLTLLSRLRFRTGLDGVTAARADGFSSLGGMTARRDVLRLEGAPVGGLHPEKTGMLAND
jgi:hypothetical protein